MRHHSFLYARALVLALAVGACTQSDEEKATTRAAAIEVVEQFGGRLMHVNLLAEPDTIRQRISEHYRPYVTTLLLGGWMSDPRTAPGRETSNPFPARIEIDEVVAVGRVGFDVTGEVLHTTELDGEPVLRTPFSARVVRGPDDIWRIAEWSSR